MTDRIVFEIEDRELQAYLGRAVRGLQRPRALFEVIGAVLEANIQGRFDSKTDPAGNAWLPRAPSTLARYAREDEGRRQGSLLERYGDMRKSLASNAGDNSVEVGFSRLTKNGKWNVAALHELGTQRMPRRQLLTDDPIAGTLGAKDRSDILRAVQEYLDSL